MPVPTADQWKKYDAATRQSWLAKMTPEQKAQLRTSLKLPAQQAAPAAAAPASGDLHNPDRYAKPTPTARKVLDYAIDQLPTVGGVGGSIAGAAGGAETGPGAVATGAAGAAAGGTLGEDAREFLGAKLYSDPARRADVKNMTAKQAAERLASEGAVQGVSELGMRGVNKAVTALAEKTGIRGAVESAVHARAGNGVQKTPGEISGNRAQKMLEHFLTYIPGAMGPMGRFEEMRAGQTAATLEKELDQIAGHNLPREQSGDAIAKVIDTMHANARQEAELAARTATAAAERAEKTAIDEANQAYNPLKGPLGLPADATRAQVEAAAQAAAKPVKSGVLDAAGKPTMTGGDGGKALRELKAADAAYGAAQRKAEAATVAAKAQLKSATEQAEAKIQADIVTKLANTNRTEAMHTMIAKSSMKDLRELMPRLDPATRAAVGRNVLEDALNAGRDPVSKDFDARAALKALDTLDKDGPKAAVLFGKNAATVREALKDIASIQRQHSPGGGMAGHRVFSTLLAAIPAATVGLATGHMPLTIALAGGEMGAARMLASLVTNPETSLSVLTGLRRIAAGTVRLGVPMATDAYRQASLPSGNLMTNGQINMPAAQ